MISSFLIQLVGLWLLSMSINKHFRQAFNRRLTSRLEHSLNTTGWVLLSISLWLICQLTPLPLMLVYWISVLALNITLIALLNSYQEHKK